MLKNLAYGLLTTTVAFGCGEVAQPTGPDTVDPSDETQPTVVASVPAKYAVGIPANQRITIMFDESMDKTSVGEAYRSNDLPPDKVTFVWNDDATILTIEPMSELVYAEGIGLEPADFAAKTYALSFDATATDRAGNPLPAPFVLEFATKRRMAAAFPIEDAMSRARAGGTLLGVSNDMWIGDNAVNSQYRSYITFDLSQLPQNVSIESAQFSARQLAAEGAPYNLGDVMANHVTYATASDILSNMLPHSLPGAFASNATPGSTSIDVTPQVADDVTNRTTRNNRTQYRLQMDAATDNDSVTDKASFAKGTFELSLVYIAD